MSLPYSCADFLIQFLVTRNLNTATGNHLYSYKVSLSEYQVVKTTLSNSRINEKAVSACFVLFAAEWWRRNYRGGHWEWEPIFEAINQADWNTSGTRNALMLNGTRYWKRQIFQHENGPNSLLGTLFFESGIPLQLLTHEGYIKNLIVKSFSFLQTYHTRPEDTVACIQDLARVSQMPDALNVDSFYKLIYEVITTLLRFKTTYRLGNQEQPLAYLNQHVPAWHEELPLRIDDDQNASSFLDSLLVDVAKMARQEVSKISVQHTLNQRQGGWRINTIVSIPDGFHKPENLQMDAEAYASLSGKVAIKIVFDGHDRLIGYGFKTGNNQLSITGLSTYTLPDNIHTTNWKLVFADCQTDHQLLVNLPYSDGLDSGIPWVFATQNDSPPTLKGVGSVRLSASQALVVCPMAFELDAPDGGATHLGSFSDTQVIYRISSTCLFKDHQDDQVFSVKVAEPNDDPYYVVVYPQSNSHFIPFYQKQNAGIYLGFPRIRKMHKMGGVAFPIRDILQYKTTQNGTWQLIKDTSSLVGRFKIRSVGPENEVLFSKELAVLPANFAVRFDTVNQQLILDHSAAFALSVHSDEVAFDLEIRKEGSGHRIRVKAGSTERGLRLRLLAPSTRDIMLHVPLPAASAHFLDAEGNVLPNNQKIDLQRLHGTQFVLNNVSANQQTSQIVLALQDIHDPDAAQHRISKTVKIAPFSNLEISLIKYRSDIERLLSFSRAIDAVVRIQYNGGMSVCVSQYAYQTQYDNQTDLITLSNTIQIDDAIQLQAFTLNERFSSGRIVNQERHNTGWCFPEDCPRQGKWFYFSAANSAVSIRPSVAIRTDLVDEDTSEMVEEFHEASNHSYKNRQAVLTNLFDRIANDFSHINWKTLQQLNKCTSHLPFTALDVWKALLKSDGGLVTFFLLFDPTTIAKLSHEFSVNWYRIPVSTWLNGFRAFQAYMPASIAAMVLNQKIQELEAGCSLRSLAQIIRTMVLNETATPDFQMCLHSVCIQPLVNDEIMGRQGNPGLIQKHRGRQFPIYLSQELIIAFHNLPPNIQNLAPIIPANFGYIRPVAYLPILLAYRSVWPQAGINITAVNQLHLKQLIDFDEDYFNLIYNLIQAHCWLTNPIQ